MKTQEKIQIIAPYFYESVLEYLPLIEVMKKGIKVEIITAKERDIQCYSTFQNNILFHDLIKNGAEVYEFPGQYLHGKAFLFDNKILSLGSFNLDGWSFKNNTGNITNNRN